MYRESTPTPTLEEMLQYWGFQNRLNICHGCIHEPVCWSMPGVAYSAEAMEHCPYPEIREAVKRIQEMKRDKPLGFYAIRGDWWSCEELWKTLRVKKTEKP